MLRHYLVISARSMFQHKPYSLINVVGLSVALACARRPHAEYAHRIVNLLDGAIVTEKVRLAV